MLAVDQVIQDFCDAGDRRCIVIADQRPCTDFDAWRLRWVTTAPICGIVERC